MFGRRTRDAGCGRPQWASSAGAGLDDGGRIAVVGVRPFFLARSVILSTAKNLAHAARKTRFFAAFRMTELPVCQKMWPHTVVATACMGDCAGVKYGRAKIGPPVPAKRPDLLPIHAKFATPPFKEFHSWHSNPLRATMLPADVIF